MIINMHLKSIWGGKVGILKEIYRKDKTSSQMNIHM